jgi:hypothetical protein
MNAAGLLNGLIDKSNSDVISSTHSLVSETTLTLRIGQLGEWLDKEEACRL